MVPHCEKCDKIIDVAVCGKPKTVIQKLVGRTGMGDNALFATDGNGLLRKSYDIFCWVGDVILNKRIKKKNLSHEPQTLQSASNTYLELLKSLWFIYESQIDWLIDWFRCLAAEFWLNEFAMGSPTAFFSLRSESNRPWKVKERNQNTARNRENGWAYLCWWTGNANIMINLRCVPKILARRCLLITK